MLMFCQKIFIQTPLTLTLYCYLYGEIQTHRLKKKTTISSHSKTLIMISQQFDED